MKRFFIFLKRRLKPAATFLRHRLGSPAATNLFGATQRVAPTHGIGGGGLGGGQGPVALSPLPQWSSFFLPPLLTPPRRQRGPPGVSVMSMPWAASCLPGFWPRSNPAFPGLFPGLHRRVDFRVPGRRGRGRVHHPQDFVQLLQTGHDGGRGGVAERPWSRSVWNSPTAAKRHGQPGDIEVVVQGGDALLFQSGRGALRWPGSGEPPRWPGRGAPGSGPAGPGRRPRP